VRFTRWMAGLWAGLLAACGSSVPLPPAMGTAGVGGAPVSQPGPGAARTWDEYRLRAARRIHAASVGETFNGPLPDPLQSIPVLQVRLNGDGSVRDIVVLRVPGQSPQTVDLASAAIRRAAPFEPVAHLPRPWQFNETFLYNQELKFQLRTLVEAP
jgi:hypothetical protein